jgi:hypothetical protein
MRFALLETKLAIVKALNLVKYGNVKRLKYAIMILFLLINLLFVVQILIQLDPITTLSAKNAIWLRAMRRKS